jgi:hypothetical protein
MKQRLLIIIPLMICSSCIDIKLMTAPSNDPQAARHAYEYRQKKAEELATILYTLTDEEVVRNSKKLDEKAQALVKAFISSGLDKFLCGLGSVTPDQENALKMFIKQFAQRMVKCSDGSLDKRIIIGREEFYCAKDELCLGGNLNPFC